MTGQARVNFLNSYKSLIDEAAPSASEGTPVRFQLSEYIHNIKLKSQELEFDVPRLDFLMWVSAIREGAIHTSCSLLGRIEPFEGRQTGEYTEKRTRAEKTLNDAKDRALQLTVHVAEGKYEDS